MNTEKIIINSENDRKGIERVAEILKKGGIAAIPTETVYGLAANALDEKAVETAKKNGELVFSISEK